MSEPNEPSYYEIALTNRQVVVAFVLILSSVMAAFLSGVWVGSQGSSANGQIAEVVEDSTAAEKWQQIPPLDVFEEGNEAPPPSAPAPPPSSAEELDKPDLSPLLEERNPQTTLAQDVGAQDAAKKQRRNRRNKKQNEAQEDPPPPSVEPPKAEPKIVEEAPPPPTRPVLPPPSATSNSASGADPGFIIQVFSSRDEVQARKVMGDLKKSGYQAFLLPTVAEPKMYRVRIGPFPQREEADKVAQKVKAQHKIDTWVTSADN